MKFARARTSSVILAALALTLASAARAETLQGTYGGEAYDIDLDDSWGEIEGEWGDVSYDLEASASWHTLGGSVDGGAVKVEYSTSWVEMKGETPCGSLDLDGSLSWKEIKGTVCGESVEVDVAFEDDVVPTLLDLGLADVVDRFPRPVRASVTRFILRKMGL